MIAASSRWTNRLRTNVPHIFAIGDIVGEPMLAHKASSRRQDRRGSHRRAQGCIRRAHHSVGGLHRSRDRMDGPDRNAGQGAGHRDREGGVSLGRERPRARAMARDEGMTKLLFDKNTQPAARCGHGRAERRRVDRGNGAGAGNGRRRAGHRAHHPPASDLVRNGFLRRRNRRRQHHRSSTCRSDSHDRWLRPIGSPR